MINEHPKELDKKKALLRETLKKVLTDQNNYPDEHIYKAVELMCEINEIMNGGTK